MKKALIIMTITLGALIAVAGPWVPISVNTNTWECKPAGATFTNYWNNIATTSAVPSTPTTLTSSPPISVSSPYYTAELWWDFVVDNGKGTNIIDATANGEDGYEVSGHSIEWNQPTWQDYSLSVSSISETGLLTERDDLLDGAAQVSLAWWFKLDQVPDIADYAYMWTVSGDFSPYTVGHIPAMAVDEFVFLGGVGAQVTNTVTVDGWHHYTTTKSEDGTYETWIDGVKTHSVTGAASLFFPSTQYRIGGSVDSDRYIDGTYDDFAMWSRILSPTEITNIYNNARSTNALWYSESEW